MARTRRINIVKTDIYPFRHSPGRNYRQAISRRSPRDDDEIDYKPKTRHTLSKSNLTSAWEDVYKGVFEDNWANGTNQDRKRFSLEQLEILKVFIYYNKPCLFSCRDRYRQIYLTVFADETETHETWLYTPVSTERYWRVESGKLDLYSSFKYGKKGISYIVNISIDNPHDIKIEPVSSVDVPDLLLPEKNTFINVNSKA